ncbi:MAG: cytosine permease [Microbacteriaceae bacterium]|nr:MAG: cytosine permease [Microbacteriaceae bacterium]
METPNSEATNVPVLEIRTVRPIPLDERHGKGRNLFTIWFTANMSPVAFITGALGPTVFGLSFWWSIVAMVIGACLGALLMAFHSAQGPRLGLPQMIQSRGQFGAIGAIVIMIIVVLMYLGFFASAAALAGQSTEIAVGGLGTNAWIVITSLLSVVVAALGYRYLHFMGNVGTVLCGGVMLASAIVLAVNGQASADFFSRGGFNGVGFLAMFSITAMWVIAFAPYVSDYSRYMPPTFAGVKSTFWNTYAGVILGACTPITLGVALAIAVPGKDANNLLAGTAAVLGTPMSDALLLAFVFVVIHANAMNLYGGALTLLSCIQTAYVSWNPGARARIVAATIMAFVAVTVGIVFSGDFVNNYESFISLLIYTLIPWSIINLLDFYVVRKGHYDLTSLLARHAGIYGNFRWPALITYAVAIICQIPFMSSPMYTGVVAKMLSGADISWIVCVIVTVPLYLWLSRNERDKFEPASPTRSAGLSVVE